MEDSNPGSGMIDAAGNHAVGCPSGCPTSTPSGRHGNGFLFSGAEYLQILAKDLDMPIRTAYTVGVWAYVDAFSPREACAFTKPSAIPNHDGNSFSLCVDKNKRAYAYITNASSVAGKAIFGPALQARRWHHLAATWDAATMTETLDVDGVWSVDSQFGIDFDGGIPIVGADADTNASELRLFWTGILDDAVLYDRVLNHDEHCVLADQPLGCWPAAAVSPFPSDRRRWCQRPRRGAARQTCHP